jgi:hypothetical protein
VPLPRSPGYGPRIRVTVGLVYQLARLTREPNGPEGGALRFDLTECDSGQPTSVCRTDRRTGEPPGARRCRRKTRASSWASLRLTRRTLGSAERQVARATREAKLRPGGVVPAEVRLARAPEDIEELPRLYVTRMPKVKDWLP